jgi:DNA-binding MarR family transcriptional regulator
MSELLREIQQTKPFQSLRDELWLNLSRTAAVIGHEVEQRLRPHGLSPTQYNVLRILRGAGEQGLMQYEVGDRLVAQVPDVPRILARMAKAGWIERVRGTVDRRVVRATLTPNGLKLVNELDAMMDEVEAGLFPAMSEEEIRHACDLLVLARRGSGNGNGAGSAK